MKNALLARRRTDQPLVLRLATLLACWPLVGCSGVDLLDAATPNTGYVAERGLKYGEDARQVLDVYLPDPAPATVPPGGKAPVIVFIYGGSWQMGDRRDYRFVGQSFASAGYLTIIPDYRLYPKVRFPSFVEDAAHAVRWAADNAARYGADPTAIYLIGHSAGAHTVAMLNYDERFLKAAGVPAGALRGMVGLAGPYDFVPEDENVDILSVKTYPGPVMPTGYVDGTEPPALLITGEDDDIVKPGNTDRLAARIREKGGRVEVVKYPKLDHYKIAGAMGTVTSFFAPVRANILNFLGTGQALPDQPR